MSLSPVTLWYREETIDDVKVMALNHLEDGHCQAEFPTPKLDIHKRTWKGGKWEKKLCMIDESYKIIHEPAI